MIQNFLLRAALPLLVGLLTFGSATPAAGQDMRVAGSSDWRDTVRGWGNDTASTWNDAELDAGAPNARKFRQIHLDQVWRGRRQGRVGITVAIIDGGVDFAHPFLRGAIDTERARNFLNGSKDARDIPGGSFSGHGTAVAGIIHQIAPTARLLPLKVLEADGQGRSEDVATAINYAVNAGVQVINLSLGSRERKERVAGAVRHATSRGIIVVCSVGNENNGQADYPAAEAGQSAMVISVGSVDDRNLKSSFSNYGATKVNANGEHVATLYPAGTVNATGTSFATPQVAGLAALALSEGKLPSQVVRGLVGGAQPIDSLQGNWGYAGRLGGLVDAGKLFPGAGPDMTSRFDETFGGAARFASVLPAVAQQVAGFLHGHLPEVGHVAVMQLIGSAEAAVAQVFADLGRLELAQLLPVHADFFFSGRLFLLRAP